MRPYLHFGKASKRVDVSNIVALIGIHDHIENIPNNLEELADKAKLYEQARKLVSTLAASKGGKVIGMIEGNEIVELPLDAAEVLKEIHDRLSQEIGLDCEIGVGEDSRQANEALNYAKKNARGSIKVYRPEFEEESEENAADEIPQDIKEIISKSEKYQPIDENDRQKITQILLIIQQNKLIFDQLKLQDPQVYAGIVSLVQSINGILQYDKVAKEQHLAEMLDKLNKQVQKEKQKQVKSHGKEIDRHLKAKSKKQDKRDQKEDKAMLKSAKERHQAKLGDAQRFAEESGHHDPKFLVRLLGALD